MAPPYSKQLAIPAIGDNAEIRRQIGQAIESIWQTVRGSRRTMADAREAIARADVALARRLSDRR